MIVDIEKVIVKDRIRKDFGDIQELADDIKLNGLINPPVVNKNYELLAGERRLRACKELGWNQIEVRMMDTKDEEHDFEIEVSENESRKDFSRTEREAIYTRRVMARMKNSSPTGLNSNDIEREVASELNTSRTNMQREQFIVQNKSLLDPSDFTEWDEGKLSTNKAFQKVKASLEQAKRQHIIDSERIKILEKQEPEVIEKEIIKEVVPEDYEKIKRENSTIRSENDLLSKERKQYLDERNKANARIKELEEREGIHDAQIKLERESEYLGTQINSFIRNVGGYVWVTEQIEKLPEEKRMDVIKAIRNINAWSQQMLINIGGTLNE